MGSTTYQATIAEKQGDKAGDDPACRRHRAVEDVERQRRDKDERDGQAQQVSLPQRMM